MPSQPDRDIKAVFPRGHLLGKTPHANASRESGEATRQAETTELHICPDCASELVMPVDWEPAGIAGWRVELRCPECEWRGVAVRDQATMDRFDEALDHGTETLLDDLAHLTRAIMEEEVERFIAALHRDLILPEDF